MPPNPFKVLSAERRSSIIPVREPKRRCKIITTESKPGQFLYEKPQVLELFINARKTFT